jgi:tetratricopeptide (TPR) repeat protein
MEGWMGKNAALCENIGHTYNTIGAYSQAEQYFQDALTLTRHMPNRGESNEGGILLGLAGVQERRGSFAESLPTAQKAYDFYKERDKQRGWETSLTAKAGMQLSKVHMKLGDLGKAQKHVEESIRLFEITSGDDTPLLAGAYDRLGDILVLQGREDAQKAFHKAYQLEAIKDAFDLVPILEIHNKLVDSHVKMTGLDRKAFSNYFGVVGQVVERVRQELKQDGNAGAYYKSAGEMYVLGADCDRGRPLLQEAIRLFEVETVIDTSGLIRQCADLVAYCDGTLDTSKLQGSADSNSDEL